MSSDEVFLDNLFIKDLLGYDDLTVLNKLSMGAERNGAVVEALGRKMVSGEAFSGLVDVLERTKQWYLVHVLGRKSGRFLTFVILGAKFVS